MITLIEDIYIITMSVIIIGLLIRLLVIRDSHPFNIGHQPRLKPKRSIYETKIKMFRGSDVLMLEKDINEWLKDNHQYVKEIIYQDNLTAMIIYRPRVEPMPPPDEE